MTAETKLGDAEALLEDQSLELTALKARAEELSPVDVDTRTGRRRTRRLTESETAEWNDATADVTAKQDEIAEVGMCVCMRVRMQV